MATSPTSTTRSSRIRHWPDLTFYYGISPAELAEIPRVIVEAYIEALPRLLAERQTLAIEAASFPYMEEADRRRAMDGLKKFLPDEEAQPLPLSSPGEAVKITAGMGFAVEYVDAEGNPVIPDA